MARIAGIQTKKNSKGEITHVTIDVRKHKQAVPFLTQIGALEEDDFEREWNDPANMTIEEAKAKSLAHIDALWDRKK
jgi:hypothetical protein